MPGFSIPSPCPQPWATMTPTAAGRFCGQCQHEVVDFSAFSEVEVHAWLARPGAGTICGFFRAGQFAAPVAAAPAPRWRRLLLTGLALLSFKPLLTSCQSAGSSQSAAATTASSEQASARQAAELTANLPAAPAGQVTIRGWVFDGDTKQGVAEAQIFIGDTPYGVTTDENGYFSFTMRQEWAPVQNGAVSLRVAGSPFVFVPQVVRVAVAPAPAPLLVRLASQPERGNIMGKVNLPPPPQKPPL